MHPLRLFHRQQDLKTSGNNRPLKNERGVAIIIAMAFMAMMIFIAMEVSFDTTVEHQVTSKSVNRLKAYYNAKSAVEIGLLRIHIYRMAIGQFGKQLGEKKSMLDPIWNFPFAWPVSEFAGDQLGAADKEILQGLEGESLVEGRYFLNIENEGSKIDINELGSSVDKVALATRNQLLKMFTSEVENNEAFAEVHRNTNWEELINNLQDWVDADSESRNGGDESRSYTEFEMPNPLAYPPNAPFKTMEEILMVKDMTEDIFKVLKNKITVYGIMGINPNYSSKEVLQALDPKMTDEMVAEILKRRNDPQLGGPFTNEEDFKSFLGGLGLDTSGFNDDGIPLVFEPVYNFRVIATGEYKNVTREVQAVTFDVDQLKSRLATQLDKQDQPNPPPTPNPPANPPPTPAPAPTNGGANTSQPLPKGRPTVIYWNEN